jgi:hypothetical protein
LAAAKQAQRFIAKIPPRKKYARIYCAEESAQKISAISQEGLVATQRDKRLNRNRFGNSTCAKAKQTHCFNRAKSPQAAPMLHRSLVAC